MKRTGRKPKIDECTALFIKEKIEENPKQIKKIVSSLKTEKIGEGYITTVKGVGYKFIM